MKKIDKKDHSQHFSLALEVPSERHLEAYGLLNQTHLNGIAVLLNRPAHTLVPMLDKRGVDVNRLTFADHVSKAIGSDLEQVNTVYSEGKYTMSKTDALLTTLVEKLNKEKKLLIFDALHDLHAYYDDKTLLRAIDFLIDRARILHLNPVFIYDRKKVTARVAKRLGAICDQIVKL